MLGFLLCPEVGVAGYGCVASLDCVTISTDTFDITDGIMHSDMDGAKPMATCIRSQALRTGPMAFGGVCLPTIFTPIDKPIMFSWYPVQQLCANGILLGGAPVEKYFDTSEGQTAWKLNCKTILVHPGQVLFIPFGFWPRATFYDPPSKGFPSPPPSTFTNPNRLHLYNI